LDKKEVIQNYDREGASYDSMRYGRTRGGRYFSEVELSNTLKMLKPGSVLHVGTATGRVSTYLASKGFDYVGLEISETMARISAAKLNGRGSIVRGDAEHLPFKPGSFDNVVSVRSFHFLPHPESFMRDANLILRQTGRLTVSFEKYVPGREAFRKLMKLPPSIVRRTYYTNSHVSSMMRSAGFQPLLVRNATKFPLLVYWRTKNDVILRKMHGKIPSLLGTVGVVVGGKQNSLTGRLEKSTPVGVRSYLPGD